MCTTADWHHCNLYLTVTQLDMLAAKNCWLGEVLVHRGCDIPFKSTGKRVKRRQKVVTGSAWFSIEASKPGSILGEANETIASPPFFQRWHGPPSRVSHLVLACFVTKLMNHSRAPFNKLWSKSYDFPNEAKIMCKCAKGVTSINLMCR